MKKKIVCRKWICLLLVGVLGLQLTGCITAQAKDLMEGITPRRVTALEDLSAQNAAITDFAVRLFSAGAAEGENTLISPLSVLCALAMTANGAEGETRAQMEAVLGMSVEELNLYLYSYRMRLPRGDRYKLSLANSIWFTEDERFEADPDFLQTNADYYGADLYQAPFDGQTCKEINNWVKKHTEGMIPQILDEIPPEAVMYLVNALAFEAEWPEAYQKSDVREGTFTLEDRSRQTAEFMYGTEGSYLEDDRATGFIKYYAGGQYAFAALLPKEGVRVADYIASLDGEGLNALLSAPQRVTVYTAIPKFETEYGAELSGILAEMGMPKAFVAGSAEFGGIGECTEGDLYISRVLHKTFISVGEKGTRAGAATAVEIVNESAAVVDQEPKRVYLDRPFVYMLIDCENNIPFFIGTMMTPEK